MSCSASSSKKEECQRRDWYNAAAVAALSGEKEVAIERLYQCQKRYKKWYSHNLESDTDLLSLHSENRWRAICTEDSVRREKAEKDFDRPLISELQGILKKDQSVRFDYINARRSQNEVAADSLLKVMRAVDEENEAHLFKILDTRGWVSHKIVGEATHVFFTILQHSGLENQKKYLPKVKQALKNGDMTTSQYAYYEDRINVFEGKPQRYGTQLKKNSNGVYEACTLENPQMVDRWRKKAGLPPLKDYIAEMQTRN